MRKGFIAAAAFVLSVLLGVLLLVIGEVLVALAQMLRPILHQQASGIGAVAGGVSHFAVLLVPVLCGVLGAVLALRRFHRPRASSQA